MQYIGVIVALSVSLCVVGYIMMLESRKDTKIDYKKLVVIFITTFVVLYALYILITDVNNTDEIFNNIKGGEPPF